jgi:hypothetical protein
MGPASAEPIPARAAAQVITRPRHWDRRRCWCADIELISADQINDAYERVLASDVRYRFVIHTATLG